MYVDETVVKSVANPSIYNAAKAIATEIKGILTRNNVIYTETITTDDETNHAYTNEITLSDGRVILVESWKSTSTFYVGIYVKQIKIDGTTGGERGCALYSSSSQMSSTYNLFAFRLLITDNSIVICRINMYNSNLSLQMSDTLFGACIFFGENSDGDRITVFANHNYNYLNLLTGSTSDNDSNINNFYNFPIRNKFYYFLSDGTSATASIPVINPGFNPKLSIEQAVWSGYVFKDLYKLSYFIAGGKVDIGGHSYLCHGYYAIKIS